MDETKSNKRLSTVFIIFSITFGTLLGLMYSQKPTINQRKPIETMQMAVQEPKEISQEEEENIKLNGLVVENYTPYMEITSPQNLRGMVASANYPGEDFAAVVMDETGNVLGISTMKKFSDEEISEFEGTIEFEPRDENKGYVFFEDVAEENGTEVIYSQKIDVIFKK